MSYVTDVLVYVDYAPTEVHEALSVRLAKLDETQALGGAALRRKAFQGDIYAGAFNYLRTDDFCDWFKGLKWEKGSALMLLCSEGEEWRVAYVRDGIAVD